MIAPTRGSKDREQTLPILVQARPIEARWVFLFSNFQLYLCKGLLSLCCCSINEGAFMHNQRFLTFALSLFLLTGLVVACAPSSAPAAGDTPGAADTAAADTAAPGEQVSISVSGAFALFPLMALWAEEYQALNPNVQFDVQAGGAGKGMTDMLSGAADIAMLSREARPEELEQGSFLVPVTIDSVLATTNAANPYLADLQAQGLTPEHGASLWLNATPPTWGALLGTDAAETVNVYTRSDASGAAEMWAKYLGGEAQEELKGTAVNGDPGLAEAVRQDTLSIGYNNVGFAYDPATGAPIEGLAIVPLDLDGDGAISADENFYATRDEFTAAVAEGKYPFPPARVLYLVTKGEPSPAIADFYRWVLTDGQQFVQPAGYVALTQERIDEALGLLPATAGN
jgi:phosphate transport system substrate-binding protein